MLPVVEMIGCVQSVKRSCSDEEGVPEAVIIEYSMQISSEGMVVVCDAAVEEDDLAGFRRQASERFRAFEVVGIADMNLVAAYS